MWVMPLMCSLRFFNDNNNNNININDNNNNNKYCCYLLKKNLMYNSPKLGF